MSRILRRRNLKKILEFEEKLHSYNLQKANFSRLDLTKKDLSNLNLSGSKFKKTNLEKADLSCSSLKNSCFYKSLLQETQFVDSDCQGSDFSKAIFSGANLAGAHLRKINAFKSRMDGVNLKETILEESDLRSVDLRSCKAERSELKKANLTSAILTEGNFHRANLESAVLTEARAEKAKFSGCFLRRATFIGAVLHDTEFYQADLTGANFRFASLHGVKLEGAILNNADFRYSFGLSSEMNRYLHDNGAKVSFLWHKMETFIRCILGNLWSKLLLSVFLIALGFICFFYFNNPIHKTESSLMYELQIARDNQKYEKALQIDSILIEKLKRQNNLEEIFFRKLDDARFYKFLKNMEKSMEILIGLLDSYGQSPEKKARVDYELALIHKLEGNMTKAIAILENIDLSLHSNMFAYNVCVHLARSYSASKQYEKAVSILKIIIEEYSSDTWRQYNALHDLELVYIRNGENEKAFNILENLTWDLHDPFLSFRSWIDLVDILSRRRRYQEAKNICDHLLIKVKDNSELSAEVNDRLKIINSKVGRN